MDIVDAIGLCLGSLLTIAVFIIIGGLMSWYAIYVIGGE